MIPEKDTCQAWNRWSREPGNVISSGGRRLAKRTLRGRKEKRYCIHQEFAEFLIEKREFAAKGFAAPKGDNNLENRKVRRRNALRLIFSWPVQGDNKKMGTEDAFYPPIPFFPSGHRTRVKEDKKSAETVFLYFLAKAASHGTTSRLSLEARRPALFLSAKVTSPAWFGRSRFYSALLPHLFDRRFSFRKRDSA
ncbi:unnamed protein product [Bursaphelenchus xylophilus]|uniref:(pine wood nematode) hypothetical protein n=1 Tax=Bursaphelenchus xylophilus TaxID=6326 RepID=A0A1I7RHB4_BURXY|nr:unnamed protein product [Bursaphelenchus xylophilus]CAG9115878.1 unnamed protein product [Bursaphelenchus xylophilus]